MAKTSITKTSPTGTAKQADPVESALGFLPFDEMDIGRLIAEALMARGTPNLSTTVHHAMQGSSRVGLGFIAACDERLARV